MFNFLIKTDKSRISNVQLKCVKYNLYLTLGLILLFGILYQTSIIGIIRLWSTIGTYNHGFLVIPIVIWLLWRNKYCINCINIKSSYSGVFFTLLCTLVWVVSYKYNFVFGHHLAFFLLVISIIWSIWGWEFIKYNLFPLFFLLFSVPFGDILIPLLQNFTATAVVTLLELSGIPVYRESLYFYIPSGAFEVAKACSGIRYLIASITIGVLYAYLRYSKIWKRILIVILSIIVPLVANGVRAYLIVLIAHLSNLELATGIDHIIYGWLFFGIVIFILMYFGSRFEDNIIDKTSIECNDAEPECYWGKKSLYVSIMLVLVLVAGQSIVVLWN